ncbi:hypothetical protein H5410_001656 [Solanum commersonii]|uniref:Isopentenyltransferase n=1 Tax=Solanum commersonii TaxID=4109 RepID=A0A9J6B088_SOLCO|nr:hypothetical protein H5410_001656 [Solanum commersonii]
MQVYKGLDIATNKITHAEKQGVRHYLVDIHIRKRHYLFLSEVQCLHRNFLKTQCVPIIVGGSNSYIEKLVEDPVFMFKYKYDSCFIWIDVEQLVLNRRVDRRVDKTVNAGLVNEVRQIFIPDIFKGRKIIDRDDESKKMIPQTSISSIKNNTHILICYQLDKIQRLINEKLWLVHQIIASDVFEEDRKEVVDEALRNTVLQPCLAIVKRFL